MAWIRKALITGNDTWQRDGSASALPVPRARPLPLHEGRKTAAVKDALADTSGTNSLGLGDAGGSALTGTTTSGTTANESATWLVPLPSDYLPATNVVVRIRAKCSPTALVTKTVDCVAKRVGDATLGTDICATNAQTLTTSYANYDFTVTGASLDVGDMLQIDVYLATDDTGGTSSSIPTATAVTLWYQFGLATPASYPQL
jgi:hypothetical protein